jgi:predicted dehydrogenase
VLIPAFKEAGARLKTVVSGAGVSGVHAGRKYGFETSGTDAAEVLRDPGVDAVVITTRHDSHARFVVDALAAGKHVFVEKPLCLSADEQERIAAAYEQAHERARAASTAGPCLMVGFNRRFAPHVVKLHALLAGATGPKALTMTVNAGAIPADHWTQDPAVGGGRIIGEACHFVDLLRFLVGHRITSHTRATMRGVTDDTVTVQLGFADGSIGTVHYFANGSKALPKERLEVFAQGRVLQLDNYRALRGFGWPGFGSMRSWRQDKGQRACAAAFLAAVAGRAGAPIPVEEILEVSAASIALAAAP